MIKTRTIAVAAAVALLPAAASGQEVTLKMLTAWDNRSPGTPILGYQYGKNLEKASKGRIKVTFSGPEVVKPRQQLQPTMRGVFDMNLTVTPYHLGTTAVGMGVYALDPDPTMWREKGVFDIVDKDYQRFNLKLVLMAPGGSKEDAYQAVLVKPLSKGPLPLKGRKVRANRTYEPIAVPLGGSMVNLNGGDIYAGMQRGVVEGAFWPLLGALDYKWYEVAKYMMRPRFGIAVYFVAMNMDRFKKLPPDLQKIVLDEARKLEVSAMPVFDARNDREEAELKKRGMKETVLDPATFKKVYAGFRTGMWEVAESIKASRTQVQQFRAHARKQGLAD